MTIYAIDLYVQNWEKLPTFWWFSCQLVVVSAFSSQKLDKIKIAHCISLHACMQVTQESFRRECSRLISMQSFRVADQSRCMMTLLTSIQFFYMVLEAYQLFVQGIVTFFEVKLYVGVQLVLQVSPILGPDSPHKIGFKLYLSNQTRCIS